MDEYVENMIQNMKNVFETVTKNRNLKMNKAKIRHDRKIKPKRYKKGDLVWIKNEQTKKGENPSLKMPYTGPFQVVEVLNDNNYICKRPIKYSKKKVVNIQRMKKCFMRPDNLRTQRNIENKDKQIIVESRSEEDNENENKSQNEAETSEKQESENESENTDNSENQNNNSNNGDISLNTNNNTDKPVDERPQNDINTRMEDSSDSINDKYYEPKSTRPKRTIKPPDYFIPGEFNTKSRNKRKIQKDNQIQTRNNSNSKIHNNQIDRENIPVDEVVDISKQERRRSKRKKKPPDLLNISK